MVWPVIMGHNRQSRPFECGAQAHAPRGVVKPPDRPRELAVFSPPRPRYADSSRAFRHLPKAPQHMPQMTTAEAIVAALLAHGLDTIYALPGVQNDHLFDALFGASDRIRTIHTRHEQGAAYMALGAALATGKPQATAAVPGPGLLNASAALLTAYSMNAPVLALVGQIPDHDIGRKRGHLHEIDDQLGILKRVVGHAKRVPGPEKASRMVAEAFRTMATGRPGPAALECGMNIWCKKGEVKPVKPLPVRQPAIDEDTLRDAAKRLGAAK